MVRFDSLPRAGGIFTFSYIVLSFRYSQRLSARGDGVVIEYIRYRVPRERHEEFEAVWAGAQTALREAPQCESYEVARGLEEPDNYIVRIEWSSLEDHEQGFRQSAGFGRFFQAVKPFFDQIEEMRHYEFTGIASPA